MASETALGSIAEPERFADLTLIRQTMLDWRFYHVLRTDRDSPLRRPCLQLRVRLRRHAAVDPHTVVKRGGETWIQGLKLVGVFEDDQE
jgi:hypothetical protein